MLTVKIGRKRYPAESLKDASDRFCAVRDALMRGASKTPTPVIFRDGQQIGYISYNGRVWAETPLTFGQIVDGAKPAPLYDNQIGAAR